MGYVDAFTNSDQLSQTGQQNGARGVAAPPPPPINNVRPQIKRTKIVYLKSLFGTFMAEAVQFKSLGVVEPIILTILYLSSIESQKDRSIQMWRTLKM